jgi:oxygen-independent coproporphyrinogen-3 oxidase
MLECLLLEWRLVHSLIEGESVNSIYFGGGTPSLFASVDITRLIDAVHELSVLRLDAEITLEVNPDDVSAHYLSAIRSAGVNRLSIGIQSLNAEILRSMNRTHDSEMALKSLFLAQESGFNRISVDLMYGLAGLTDSEWLDSLHLMANQGVDHISAYGLTLEPGTVWHRRVEQKKMQLPGDDAGRAQYQMLMDFALERGYRHYEVSNLARPGMESEHNSAYWMGSNYIGIGPSAHSYINGTRWWNVSNNARYIRSIRADALPQTREILTAANRHNEYLMTRLRMDTGIDMIEYERLFGADFGREFQQNLSKINPAWIECDAHQLKLTPEGRFFADGISASLFADEQAGT